LSVCKLGVTMLTSHYVHRQKQQIKIKPWWLFEFTCQKACIDSWELPKKTSCGFESLVIFY